MSDAFCLVLTTCPDRETARKIAGTVVEQKCAACVNILPGLLSVYEWKGQISEDEEVLLLIKTTRHRYPQLEACILSIHPYELPEVIAIPLAGGLGDYLNWIGDQCQASGQT